jgi:hypothetical protein
MSETDSLNHPQALFDAENSPQSVSASLKVLPKRFVCACVILRLLYEMAIDFGHELNRPAQQQPQLLSAASVSSASHFSFSK